MPTFEADLCIIGGGISAALLAQKVSERRPGTSIVIVEAGDTVVDAQKRWTQRQRMVDYGENPWPGDYIADQAAAGVDLAFDGAGRAGDALGRRDQPLLGRGHAAEVDVRAGRRLAD